MKISHEMCESEANAKERVTMEGERGIMNFRCGDREASFNEG